MAACAPRALGWLATDANEESLIGQWNPCQTFDIAAQLGRCTVPLHVFACNEDVHAPPANGREIASLCPTAELHEFAGMGHCSIYGHTHVELNARIEEIARRYR